MSLKESAEALLQNEMLLLLQHDAAKYPIKVSFLLLCLATLVHMLSLIALEDCSTACEEGKQEVNDTHSQYLELLLFASSAASAAC